jgi:hypothetical protein
MLGFVSLVVTFSCQITSFNTSLTLHVEPKLMYQIRYEFENSHYIASNFAMHAVRPFAIKDLLP